MYGQARRLAIIAFLGKHWTGIAIVTQGIEIQAFAISRIDFVDWTFGDTPATVNVSSFLI